MILPTLRRTLGPHKPGEELSTGSVLADLPQSLFLQDCDLVAFAATATVMAPISAPFINDPSTICFAKPSALIFTIVDKTMSLLQLTYIQSNLRYAGNYIDSKFVAVMQAMITAATLF